MSEQPSNNLSREERLAAKLRENLRRRKAQSREMKSESEGNQAGKLPAKGLPNGESES